MDKKVKSVYETTNYTKFRRLVGNRDVTETRINKILRSIDSVGQIISPIIVNENMEVIDGQARIEAFKRRGLPVYYIEVNGLGEAECIAMNINQSNWRFIDYIQFYAETGNINYTYLLRLLQIYQKLLPITAVLHAITGFSRADTKAVIKGRLICDECIYNRARKMLDYEAQHVPTIKKLPGRADPYFVILGFCYLSAEIDKQTLSKRLELYGHELYPAEGVETAAEAIERIYNKRNAKKVYIATEWKKAQERGSWYRKIWEG